jgi:hypothetical protein
MCLAVFLPRLRELDLGKDRLGAESARADRILGDRRARGDAAKEALAFMTGLKDRLNLAGTSGSGPVTQTGPGGLSRKCRYDNGRRQTEAGDAVLSS